MADDGEVVSPLSFVIERLELWAGTNGAIRPCALPLRDELVSVRSLFPVLEAMSPVESKALNLSFIFYPSLSLTMLSSLSFPLVDDAEFGHY